MKRWNPAQSAALRVSCIRAREGIGPDARKAAALAAATHFGRQTAFQDARTVAAYLPVRGEFDVHPALAAAIEAGKRCFVPVVDGDALRFRHWAPDVPVVTNRYGIAEPEAGEEIDPEALDLVLVPLVAFDAVGNRMGMGGGYYDRCFAFLGEPVTRERRRPLYVGAAFASQRVASLEQRSWDIMLDAVLTEGGWHWFKFREIR